jgi:hypothetical protein
MRVGSGIERILAAARDRRATWCAILLPALVAGCVAAAIECGQAGAAARGIVDNRLEYAGGVDPQELPSLLDELGPSRLRARWTRLLVHWPRLQPVGPHAHFAGDADGDGYDDAYVAELNALVTGLSARGVRVIVSPTGVPSWASDRRLWSRFGPGYSANLAPDVTDESVLREFGRLGAFLATGLDTPVRYLECWNEPNTAGTFYPQRRPGDPTFGLRVYASMLAAFHRGVKAADEDAVVIAGATAPRGADDVESTAPVTFARYLRDHALTRYFDAYSHHPYCWDEPEAMPRDRRAVWLANLDELIRLMPGKPFYLTEFGYGTAKPTLIGLKVSPATQARYLNRAYRYISRHPQVKALLWFMVQDLPPTKDRLGAYMGLRTTSGTRKLSWYAFAGGTSLTFTGPAVGRPGAVVRVTGALSNRVFGPLPGKFVCLQRRTASDSWRQMAVTSTGRTGTFRFTPRLPLKGSLVYRVVWNGVHERGSKTIRTR